MGAWEHGTQVCMAGLIPLPNSLFLQTESFPLLADWQQAASQELSVSCAVRLLKRGGSTVSPRGQAPVRLMS